MGHRAPRRAKKSKRAGLTVAQQVSHCEVQQTVVDLQAHSIDEFLDPGDRVPQANGQVEVGEVVEVDAAAGGANAPTGRTTDPNRNRTEPTRKDPVLEVLAESRDSALEGQAEDTSLRA